MKLRSQYLRARGGRAVVIGPAPGGGRGVIARGGAAGRAAPARRRSGRRAGPAGQRSAPKQAGRGGDLAGAARRRAVLAAAWLAVCRRCSRARRSAVCWHRAGGRRWHGMQQAGRRRNARCSRCAAGGAAVLCWCEVWPVWAAVWGCCPLLYSYVGRGRGAAVVLIGAARGEDRRRGSSARRRVQTAAAAGGCDLHTGGGAGV